MFWIGWGWLMRASPTLTTSPGADPMSKSARALARQADPGSNWSLSITAPRFWAIHRLDGLVVGLLDSAALQFV